MRVVTVTEAALSAALALVFPSGVRGVDTHVDTNPNLASLAPPLARAELTDSTACSGREFEPT